ncbi:PTS transporter subunit EIIC [Breznakia pachnodae]|uniref:PTS system beta-glucosides-specific IIC component n=1 Tax=Breznakia pachnodae TaxID=265178 RepID=A0ABU0E0L4_9FIRM|nr:PTS transporter subunit EIIC [Breznakia pachnodae]MDQ0360427.1 PTS system beta-glucosides-specific IIC component [Breznakia pachnodae]
MDKKIMEYLGGESNITKMIRKGNFQYFFIKDMGLVDLSEIKGIETISHVEMSRGKVTISYKTISDKEKKNMAKNYNELASKIIDFVGGKDNISSVMHCITRLRLEIKDQNKVDKEKLDSLDGTMGSQWANGQLQIIIGSNVGDVYEAFCQVGGFKQSGTIDENLDENKPKAKGLNRIIQVIVGSMAPVVGVLIATGLIKGVLSFCVVLGWVDNTSGTYIVLQAISDSLFYFFPVIIGFNAAKIFNCNPMITAIIGGALIYPSLITAFSEGTELTFLGIPVLLRSYTASVLPIIFASWIASKIEKFMTKITPDLLKLIVVPFITIIITAPLTLMVVGPVITEISTWLASLILWVLESVPVFAGIIFGGVWQIIVLAGLHYGIGPVTMQLFLEQGFDVTAAPVSASMFALVGVSLAIFLRTRNKNLKSASLSAGVTALMGVTEPAIYTVAMPFKKAFLSAIIGGGVAGIFLMATNVITYGRGVNGILQITLTMSEAGFSNTILWCIGQLIAFGLSFVLAYFLLGKDPQKD